MKKIVRTSTSYGEMAYYKSDPTIEKLVIRQRKSV